MSRLPIVLVVLSIVGRVTAGEPGGERVDFARDVRPILAANCFTCHGAEKQKGGLRLDRKKDALAGGDNGPAFVPGKAGGSDLIARVSGIDPDRTMPPKGGRLSAEQVALLRSWIDRGAVWPDGLDEAGTTAGHWAFQPLRPTVPPRVADASWIRNAVDSFILAKLESVDVAPSPEADRTTLLRRLCLDLTGLPPAPEEVEEFVSDEGADAYERLVDRLLASPHFGERWGRRWLDLARYADSDGYEKDNPRPHAWRYRDWVLSAFNRDLPFDRFTVEQLAGDLLPDATLDQKTATGFHRNTLTNTEGGVDQEEFRVAAVVDRVNTTGTVWMGLTVGCAQCHTHKYDPILHREYYNLFAFFNTGTEVDLAAPLPGEVEAYRKALEAFEAEHAPLKQALATYDREGRPIAQAEWEKSIRPRREVWTALAPTAAASNAGATLAIRDDRSVLVNGSSPDADTYHVTLATGLTGITGFRLEALDDPSLPSKGPGRTPHGNFVLTGLHVKAAPRSGAEPEIEVHLQNASADFAQDQFPPMGVLDTDPKTGWAVAPRLGMPHTLVVETKEDVGFPGGTTLSFTIDQAYGGQHTLGRFRISAITAARPIKADDPPDDILRILAVEPGARDETQASALADYHRRVDPTYRKLAEAVALHAKKSPAPPASRAMTLAEGEPSRKTHIHLRGDFQRKGEEVQPGTPAALPPIKNDGGRPTRLDLARWLVSPENPLTARVTINRMWRDLFGRGLSPSVDDFGTRGERPSHPELLDWLAAEFPRRGWSQKGMIRLIVTSATYRQASIDRPELNDRDPLNVWLARQNRLRLEAEVIRDAALASSGLLHPSLGGPSVRPPQPAGIADLTYAGSAKWETSTGADRYRRGMYTFFRRTSPYPMLMTFDAPEGTTCAAQRERSNTPLQALTLLNDAVFVECAQALGRRLASQDGCPCPECRVERLFLLCLGRNPTDDETATLAELFQTMLRRFQADPKAAEKLAGETRPAGLDAALGAAWLAVARTVLNLDEFVTRE